MNQHPSSIKDKELVGSRHTQKGEANHDTARAHPHLVRCGDVLRFKWSLPVEPFPLTLVRQVANLERRLQFQQCLQSKSFRPLFAPNLSCLNLICPSRRTKSFRNAQVPHKDTFWLTNFKSMFCIVVPSQLYRSSIAKARSVPERRCGQSCKDPSLVPPECSPTSQVCLLSPPSTCPQCPSAQLQRG